MTQLEFVIPQEPNENDTQKDGALYCPEIGEYGVIIDGELQAGLWAEDKATATRIYHQELATRRKHAQRCPGDIPFDGSAPDTLPEITARDYYGI